LIQKKGYYDLERKGIRVVILSGGRGSGNLSNGIRSFARKKNLDISVTHITNAYDDGKSTGEVRRFFKNSILGPSDVRKIQQNQYSFLYSEPAITKFFSLRLDGENNKILEELKCLASEKKPKTNILYDSFLDLPLELKNIVLESLKHFFNQDYKKINLSDFAFSNLIYACLADKYGSLQSSEEIIQRALKLPDPVILNSTENGYIFGLTEAGELLHDEASIVDYSKVSPIYEVYYSNEPLAKSLIKDFSKLSNFEEKKYYLSSKYPNFPSLSMKAKEAIEQCDILIYGPGTQYSSLYPTYFTKGFAEVLKNARAIRVFISNIYHDSETPGFSAVDQVRQATFYLNMKGKLTNTEKDFFDAVIANNPKEIKQKYIMPNRTELEQLDIRNIHIQNVESLIDGGAHDSIEISNIIFNIYNSRWR